MRGWEAVCDCLGDFDAKARRREGKAEAREAKALPERAVLTEVSPGFAGGGCL